MVKDNCVKVRESDVSMLAGLFCKNVRTISEDPVGIVRRGIITFSFIVVFGYSSQCVNTDCI